MGKGKKSKNSDSEYESEHSDKEIEEESENESESEEEIDFKPKKNKSKEENTLPQQPPAETVLDRIYALLIGIKANQDEYKKTLDSYTKNMNKLNSKMNKLVKMQNALMTTVISSTVAMMSTDTDKKSKYGELMQNIKTFEDMINKVHENVEKLNKQRDQTTAELIDLFNDQDPKVKN